MRAAGPAPAAATDRPRRLARWLLVRVGTVAGLAALLAVVLAAPGGAQVGPILPPPPGNGTFIESWALAPTGVDPSQPSTRPSITYELRPGAAQADSVTLWNYSDAQLTFHVYATDAYNNRTGEFTLLPGAAKPTDAGAWVKLQTNFVTTPPRTSITIPFSVTVPKNTSPGDHTGGIVASLPTSSATGKGQPLTVDRRTGSRLYIRVAGPQNPALSVENLASTYHTALNPLGGTMNVSYTLRNPGNIRLGARVTISAKDIFGRTVKTHHPRLVPELLPGNAATYQEHFTGIPATLRVGAQVSVRPVEPVTVSGTPPPPFSNTTHTWAIPWDILLLLVLLYAVWWLYKRYRAESAAPPAGGGRGPTSSGPSAPPGGPARQPERALRFTGPPRGGATPP
jgi:hypothetical protein